MACVGSLRNVRAERFALSWRRLHRDRWADGRRSMRAWLMQQSRLALPAAVARCTWRAFSVLGGGDEQNLVAGAAQSLQPEPVEPQDALHVCKQHLDFLALSAGLLEGLGVGQGAHAIAHCLVDVSGDLAPRPG